MTSKFNESQVKGIDSELLFWLKFPLNKNGISKYLVFIKHMKYELNSQE